MYEPDTVCSAVFLYLTLAEARVNLLISESIALGEGKWMGFLCFFCPSTIPHTCQAQRLCLGLPPSPPSVCPLPSKVTFSTQPGDRRVRNSSYYICIWCQYPDLEGILHQSCLFPLVSRKANERKMWISKAQEPREGFWVITWEQRFRSWWLRNREPEADNINSV